jgi:hypothetical protein
MDFFLLLRLDMRNFRPPLRVDLTDSLKKHQNSSRSFEDISAATASMVMGRRNA